MQNQGAVMNPNVIAVEANNNHQLIVSFENDEVKQFDVTPFLDKGIFQELRDLSYFKRVKVEFGAVKWPNVQDFSIDILYLLGKSIRT